MKPPKHKDIKMDEVGCFKEFIAWLEGERHINKLKYNILLVLWQRFPQMAIRTQGRELLMSVEFGKALPRKWYLIRFLENK